MPKDKSFFSFDVKIFFKKILAIKGIYKMLPIFHEKAERAVNCLSCANCCKNYSPRFKTTDIKRISKFLKLKESVFINKYLIIDDDGDYVLPSLPCVFLDTNNYCQIYEVRPSDCKRFPYTDEDVFLKRTQISQKNAEFCPIVQNVMQQIIQNYSLKI